MQTVKELGKDATNSMKSVPAALDYLAVVVVQDALEDAERYPDNPVHALQLASPVFRYRKRLYEAILSCWLPHLPCLPRYS
jgi:hypothetical protein